MMKKRSVGIIGSGAVGAYYGTLLARAGVEVHFLVRSDYAHVHEHGFEIRSKNGDFKLPQVNAWPDAEAMPHVDLAIVATKTVANKTLIEILEKVTHESSQVLVLQNGLGVEKELNQALPGRQLFGGLCYLCSFHIAPGVIQHHDYGKIKLAEYRVDESAEYISADLKLLGDFLGAHGLEIELCEGLNKARWQKLVWNIPFNGLCAIHQRTTDKVVNEPVIRHLARELMEEVTLGAKACGVLIEPCFLDEMMDLTDKMAPYKPSMYLDLEAGRPLEVEDIYRRPLAAAKRAGVSLPKIEILAKQLSDLSKISHD